MPGKNPRSFGSAFGARRKQKRRLGELFELVAKVAELKVRFIKMPLFAAKAFGYVTEKLADVTGIPPITTSKEVSLSAQYLFYDTSKARE